MVPGSNQLCICPNPCTISPSSVGSHTCLCSLATPRSILGWLPVYSRYQTVQGANHGSPLSYIPRLTKDMHVHMYKRKLYCDILHFLILYGNCFYEFEILLELSVLMATHLEYRKPRILPDKLVKGCMSPFWLLF